MNKRSSTLKSLILLSLSALLWFGCNKCCAPSAVVYSEPTPSNIVYTGGVPVIEAVVCTKVNDPAALTMMQSNPEYAQNLSASVPVNVSERARREAQTLSASAQVSVADRAQQVSVADRAQAMNASRADASQSLSASVPVNVSEKAKATNSASAESTQSLTASVPVNVSERAKAINAARADGSQSLSASAPVTVSEGTKATNAASSESTQSLTASVPANVSERAKAINAAKSETAQSLSAPAQANVSDKPARAMAAGRSEPISASAAVNVTDKAKSEPISTSTTANTNATANTNDKAKSSGAASAKANAHAANASADRAMQSRSAVAEASRSDRAAQSRSAIAEAQRSGSSSAQSSFGTSQSANVPNFRQDGSASSKTTMKGCTNAPFCEFNTGVGVRAKNQKVCAVDDQYTIDIELTAYVDSSEVTLTAKLADGVSLVSSQPDAKASGRDLTWNIGKMNKGQTIKGKIVLKAQKEGELCTCFKVTAASESCCSILCAKPTLACEKSGPAEVCLGEQFSYTVTVLNNGTYPAEDVVLTITDTAEAGKQPASFRLGTIDQGQSKKVNYPVMPTKRGKLTYSAVVTSSNANQASCDLSTLVTCYSIDSKKEGPKEAIIGQKVDYKITVLNNGDRTLHDIVLADTSHPATSIVKAEGAEISGRKASWKINELKAGEKAAFNVTLSCRNTGTYTSNTMVTSREGQNSANDHTTRWKGRAALDVSMNTSDNSLCIGDTSRYRITVTNQGQEPDSNVMITVIFPEGIEPVQAQGAAGANIKGQTVTFAPYATLAPRQTLEYTVNVKAHVSGDLRPKVQVSSDSIKTPITQEESLIVN